jgi:hypothetical protein
MSEMTKCVQLATVDAILQQLLSLKPCRTQANPLPMIMSVTYLIFFPKYKRPACRDIRPLIHPRLRLHHTHEYPAQSIPPWAWRICLVVYLASV